MGLLNKKIKLTYQADPQLAGVMAWAGHVPVLAGPPLDARPPESRLKPVEPSPTMAT